MRYLMLILLISSSAHAINRDEMRKAQSGDLDYSRAKKKRYYDKEKHADGPTKCRSDSNCPVDERCASINNSGSEGVCVKR